MNYLQLFLQFITISGGLDGGSEPPAFQRAEKERLMAKEADDDDRDVLDYVASTEAENNYKNLAVLGVAICLPFVYSCSGSSKTCMQFCFNRVIVGHFISSVSTLWILHSIFCITF